MKDIRNLVVLIGLGTFVLSSCIYTNFREFKIVEIQNEKYTYISVQLSRSELSNVEHVLKYYKEKYKIKNSHIYISNNLYENSEMMYNYSKKSKDFDWLKSHMVYD